MMSRSRTSWRSVRRCFLKGEPITFPGRWLASVAFATVEHDRFDTDKFYVDPKIAYFPALRRVEPTQELAQAVTVRDDIHIRPVDRRLLAVVIYRICGREERKHGVLGHTRPVLVYEMGAVVGLQGEWDLASGPHSWRACVGRGTRRL